MTGAYYSQVFYSDGQTEVVDFQQIDGLLDPMSQVYCSNFAVLPSTQLIEGPRKVWMQKFPFHVFPSLTVNPCRCGIKYFASCVRYNKQ
jgi:hypothetical protein